LNIVKSSLIYLKRNAKENLSLWQVKGNKKYFCIGRNKTGTTSLESAFRDLGYIVGDQGRATILFGEHYFKGEFDSIIKYCRTAEVFQDVPFSVPETYKHLDRAYPGSKFILTVRDSSEQWYQSITRFHAKKFGRNGQIPAADDLRNQFFAGKISRYTTVRLHGTPDEDPYNKEIMIAHYEKHNRDVMEYFKDRPDDLLVINVSQLGAYQKFVDFLGVDSPYDDFPWENRT
jgi:hypothetical protein